LFLGFLRHRHASFLFPALKVWIANDIKIIDTHAATNGGWQLFGPYAPTLFDYARRAMPQHAPQSLGNDDVYAVSAYVLI
jgi:allophanate hydrolase subunit 1